MQYFQYFIKKTITIYMCEYIQKKKKSAKNKKFKSMTDYSKLCFIYCLLFYERKRIKFLKVLNI